MEQDLGQLVSVRKRLFSAVAASIFELACVAYRGTPPRKSLISLPRRKILRFRLGNLPGVHLDFPDEHQLARPAVLLLLLGMLALSGCAATSPPQIPAMRPVSEYVNPEATYPIDIYDPIEGFNRGMYRFNFYFDKYLFLPVTNTYETVTPDFVEKRISNFLANIRQLTTLANCLLQLKPEQTMDTVGRIMINTTFGIGGLWDPATTLGVRRHKEDFGQTLGHYGVGNGPYLVLPLFGPSNLRDTTGLVTDTAAFNMLDLFNFEDNEELGIAYVGLSAVDARHRVKFRYFETGSPFEYEMVRLIYSKYRLLEIEK